MLFGRVVAVEFGIEGTTGRRVEGLRVAFDVRHSREPTPSPATIRVWNLRDDTIALLQRPRALVRLFVGYASAGGARLVYQGNPIPKGSKVDRQGPDRIATVELGDGSRVYGNARIAASFAASVSFGEVFDAATAALGLPVAVPPPANTSAITFPGGLHAVGPARDVLHRLAVAANCHWFIRDGAIYFLPRNGGTTEVAPLFSSRAGNLIGEVSRTEDDGVEIRTLIDPAMRPGRPFRIESSRVTGNYVARDVQFVGDSGFANDFYCVITGRPLGADRQGVV